MDLSRVYYKDFPGTSPEIPLRVSSGFDMYYIVFTRIFARDSFRDFSKKIHRTILRIPSGIYFRIPLGIAQRILQSSSKDFPQNSFLLHLGTLGLQSSRL